MEDYIVSARKYRPTTFASVIGQNALTTTLKNAIGSGKLAQAYLFCGPRGVGKTTCARIFAKTINCLTPTADGEACNECESCRAFNEQRSYNIHELDAASNNSVEDIRQLVEQVRIPPQIGHYKVYIIDEVHMLSQSAFNAFLKTLEEPPRHAVFILATTEKQKILPTILSRCQIYDFNRIGIRDIVDHLAGVAAKEHIEAEPQALNVIAQKADGGMRDALSIFDQCASFCQGHITYAKVIENLNVLDYEYYFRLTDSLLHNRITDALLLFNDVLNKGFDAGEFITGLGSHFRDVMVSKDPATIALLEVSADIAQHYKDQAAACPLPFLYKAMRVCCDCTLNYRNSRNKRFLVECTLIQLGQLTAGGDDTSPGSGQGPKQQLKPIQATAQQAPGQTAKPANTATPQPTAPAQRPTTAAPQPTTPAQRPAAAPQPSASRPQQKTVNHRGGGMGFSISIKNGPVANNNADKGVNEDLVGYAANEKQQPVDEDRLRLSWNRYAARLPKEQRALSIRMPAMQYVLHPDLSVEIDVENELAAKELRPIMPHLTAFLQRDLQNSSVRTYVEIKEVKHSPASLSPSAQFNKMMEQNEALADLKGKLGLELM